jgi:RPA family protein
MTESIPSRSIAQKVFIKELHDADRELSRVRVLATVVDKFVSDTGSFGSLTLDDGSDTVQARVFREDLEKIGAIRPGDLVDLIGRVREYNGENYIALETAARVEDPNWELVRKLELYMRPEGGVVVAAAEAQEENASGPLVEEESISEDKSILVLNLLEELDEGDGVGYGELLSKGSLSETELEDILGDLMGSGDIYEPKIGRFKKV